MKNLTSTLIFGLLGLCFTTETHAYCLPQNPGFKIPAGHCPGRPDLDDRLWRAIPVYIYTSPHLFEVDHGFSFDGVTYTHQSRSIETLGVTIEEFEEHLRGVLDVVNSAPVVKPLLYYAGRQTASVSVPAGEEDDPYWPDGPRPFGITILANHCDEGGAAAWAGEYSMRGRVRLPAVYPGVTNPNDPGRQLKCGEVAAFALAQPGLSQNLRDHYGGWSNKVWPLDRLEMQSALMHELGHILGLKHLYNNPDPEDCQGGSNIPAGGVPDGGSQPIAVMKYHQNLMGFREDDLLGLHATYRTNAKPGVMFPSGFAVEEWESEEGSLEEWLLKGQPFGKVRALPSVTKVAQSDDRRQMAVFLPADGSLPGLSAIRYAVRGLGADPSDAWDGPRILSYGSSDIPAKTPFRPAVAYYPDDGVLPASFLVAWIEDEGTDFGMTHGDKVFANLMVAGATVGSDGTLESWDLLRRVEDHTLYPVVAAGVSMFEKTYLVATVGHIAGGTNDLWPPQMHVFSADVASGPAAYLGSFSLELETQTPRGAFHIGPPTCTETSSLCRLPVVFTDGLLGVYTFYPPTIFPALPGDFSVKADLILTEGNYGSGEAVPVLGAGAVDLAVQLPGGTTYAGVLQLTDFLLLQQFRVAEDSMKTLATQPYYLPHSYPRAFTVSESDTDPTEFADIDYDAWQWIPERGPMNYFIPSHSLQPAEYAGTGDTEHQIDPCVAADRDFIADWSRSLGTRSTSTGLEYTFFVPIPGDS